MLPREFSTWGQPFCGTGLDHARDDELGALGVRGRDIRSSRGGRSKKLGIVSGWRPRRLQGRGQPAGCATEPCANNERPQPDTDEVPNLQPGHNRDCYECDRPNIICARNTCRDRAAEGKTHHGNENEDLEPLTKRDPSNKANTTSEIAMVETPSADQVL